VHAAPVRLTWQGSSYEVAVEANGVVLRGGRRKSMLGDVGGDPGNPNEMTLLWAGDLDGDGKLDLIFEWSTSPVALALGG